MRVGHRQLVTFLFQRRAAAAAREGPARRGWRGRDARGFRPQGGGQHVGQLGGRAPLDRRDRPRHAVALRFAGQTGAGDARQQRRAHRGRYRRDGGRHRVAAGGVFRHQKHALVHRLVPRVERKVREGGFKATSSVGLALGAAPDALPERRVVGQHKPKANPLAYAGCGGHRNAYRALADPRRHLIDCRRRLLASDRNLYQVRHAWASLRSGPVAKQALSDVFGLALWRGRAMLAAGSSFGFGK